MRKLQISLCLLFVFALKLAAIGQTLQASVKSSRISINEALVLNVQASDINAKVQLESSDNWRLLNTPSESTEIRVLNGKRSISKMVTYELQALKMGKLKTPKAYWLVNGNTILSESFEITVTEKKQIQVPTNNTGVFLVADPNKKEAYLGEEILVDFYLYSKYNNTNLSSPMLLEADGFWTEAAEVADQAWRRTNYKGSTYIYKKISTKILYPQQVGELTISSAEVNAYYSESFPFGRSKEVFVQSEPIDISVKALPEGNAFSSLGAFESLEVALSLAPQLIDTDEGTDATLTFLAKGNVRNLAMPKLSNTESIDSYDPSVDDNITVSENGMTGKRSFKQLLLAREAGNFVLGGLQYSYFDYTTETWKNIQIPKRKLQVNAGSAALEGKDFSGQGFLNVVVKDERTGSWLSLFLGGLGLVLISSVTTWYFLHPNRKKAKKKSEEAPLDNAYEKWQLQKARILTSSPNEQLSMLLKALAGFGSTKWDTEMNWDKKAFVQKTEEILGADEAEQLNLRWKSWQASQYGGQSIDVERETAYVDQLLKRIDEQAKA